MEYLVKETTLTDGSKVFDVDLIANGTRQGTGQPMCIFSCTSAFAADRFLAGLKNLVAEHTVETLRNCHDDV